MQLHFPNNFTRFSHPVVPGAIQYKPNFETKEHPVFISVVGGGVGLYGDGVTTFELMIGDKVHGFLSADEVTEKVNQVLELITY